MRITVLALGLAAVSPLGAQQDTTVRRDTAVLAPTVVTVTRTSEPLARAPFAIGVVTRDQIQRGGPGFALDEALGLIPGVQVDNRFNYALGERISVRGIGARAQFGVRGVRVLLDGIPMTLADGQTTLNNVDVSQLARAEVIRGPASMLHGNAAGGVIQLESDRATDVTERPLGGELRAMAGDHGLLRTTATVAASRPAVDLTAGVSRLRSGGFRQWSDARNDRAHVRFARGLGAGALAIVANIVDYDSKNPGALSRALLAANRDTVSAANFGNRTGERGGQAQVGATWQRLVRDATLSLAVHGLQRSIDNPIPGAIVAVDRRAGGGRLAVERTVAEAAAPTRLAAGAEIQLQHDDRRNFVNNAGARGAATLDQRERVRNAGLFAQASSELAARVTFLAGARWDHVAFRADDRLLANGDDSGERTMSTISPSVGLTMIVVPGVSLFANVSSAFETPTTSELSNQESGAGGLNPDLEPQRALSTEAGVRGSAIGNRVVAAWEVAVHAARVRDALVAYQNAVGRTYYRNAAATTNRGVEVTTSIALPAGLGLRGAFTHVDARFDDYSVTTGAGTTVYDGRRVPGVAANRFEGTLSGAIGPAVLDVDARVYSSVAVNDANSDRAPGYTLWGARLGWPHLRVAALRATPTVAVQNVFGRDYITAVTVNAFGGRFFEPGPGRTYNVGLTLSY